MAIVLSNEEPELTVDEINNFKPSDFNARPDRTRSISPDFTTPPLQIPRQPLFDEGTGKTFSIPTEFNERETNTVIAVEGSGQPKSNYMGALDVGKASGVVYDGAAHTILELKSLPFVLQKEAAERFKQTLEEPLEASDFVKAFMPFDPVSYTHLTLPTKRIV